MCVVCVRVLYAVCCVCDFQRNCEKGFSPLNGKKSLVVMVVVVEVVVVVVGFVWLPFFWRYGEGR